MTPPSLTMPSSETKEMHGKHREPEKEGIFHRVAYFLLRMSELICAVIVLAILARFTYLVGIGRVSVDGKIVYALVVAFGLLAAEDRHCSTGWYNNYWGYYWGRWWRFGPVGRVNVGNTGCGYWRTTLAFSFMASMAHLLSLILGIYIFREYVRVKDTVATAKKQAGKLRKSHSATHLENGHNGATSTRPGTAGTDNPPMSTVPRDPAQQV